MQNKFSMLELLEYGRLRAVLYIAEQNIYLGIMGKGKNFRKYRMLKTFFEFICTLQK